VGLGDCGPTSDSRPAFECYSEDDYLAASGQPRAPSSRSPRPTSTGSANRSATATTRRPAPRLGL